MILYRSDRIGITDATTADAHDTVMIVLSRGPRRDIVEDFLRKEKASAILVTVADDAPIEEAALAAIAGAAARFDRRIVYAAPAAARWAGPISQAAGADTALVVAPEWAEAAEATPLTRLIVVEDPSGAGRRSERLVLPFTGRSTIGFLRGTGLLFPMLRALLDDAFDVTAWRMAARSARRQSVSYWSSLATALRVSKPATALRAAQQAATIDPQNAEAHALLARILIAVERFPEAVRAVVQTIALQPDLARHYVLLGDALRGAGEHERAIAAYEKAIEMAGPDRTAYLGLARSAAHIGDAAAVRAALDNARLNGANDGSIRRASFDAHRVMGPDGAPVIFATTPTSGTASMQRIVRAIAQGWQVVRVKSPAADVPGPDTTFLDPNAQKTIYWFQGGSLWNHAIDLTPFRAIIHLRDPRDLACNQYYWALQHPNTTDPPDVAEEQRRWVKEMGIDEYVFVSDNSLSLDMMRSIAESPIGKSVVYTSYAQLCCAFDVIIGNLCRLFGTRQREAADALFLERPENVQGNSQWIKVGGTWEGADISPGRFRRELRPDTAERLTLKYAGELAMMRRCDAPFLAYHYE